MNPWKCTSVIQANQQLGMIWNGLNISQSHGARLAFHPQKGMEQRGNVAYSNVVVPDHETWRVRLLSWNPMESLDISCVSW